MLENFEEILCFNQVRELSEPMQPGAQLITIIHYFLLVKTNTGRIVSLKLTPSEVEIFF